MFFFKWTDNSALYILMQLLIRYRKGNDKYYIPTYDTYNRAIYVVFIYNRVVKMSVLRVSGQITEKNRNPKFGLGSGRVGL